MEFIFFKWGNCTSIRRRVSYWNRTPVHASKWEAETPSGDVCTRADSVNWTGIGLKIQKVFSKLNENIKRAAQRIVHKRERRNFVLQAPLQIRLYFSFQLLIGTALAISSLLLQSL